MSDEQQPPQKPTFLQILFSTFAAAFGVQSSKNRERDFTGGNIYVYMVAGVIFTLVFILVMVLIVKAVLKGSGI
jgi:hypothetical protein